MYAKALVHGTVKQLYNSSSANWFWKHSLINCSLSHKD